MAAFMDLQYDVFGLWHVILRAENDSHRNTMWLCVCMGCGKLQYITADNLTRGLTTECKSCSMTGEKHPMFGKTHTPEVRARLAEHSRSHKGEKASHWMGGITPVNTAIRNSPEYAEWRSQVFVRDDYTCQECGQRGVELNAHHIKRFADFSELRLKVSNGITLCVSCHNKTKHP